MMLRLAAGMQIQALVQNDGEQLSLSHGTPVQVYLAGDPLRVLPGEAIRPTDEDVEAEPQSEHVLAG